jgi:nucleotidyltransferase AbiEii toxin of type IV toxin-antitoxin system
VSDDTVERTQSATRIFRQIQALARSDYGGNTNALLVVYAVEGFLRRLAASPYADKMTLKGGMLMAAMSARRITKDADLSTVGVGNDEAVVGAVVAEIVATKLDVDDGLAFDTDSIRTEVKREDEPPRAEHTRPRLRRHVGPQPRSQLQGERAALGDRRCRHHRNHEVVTLATALADMPDHQQTYTAMLERMAYQRMPPASWHELLDEIRAFIDPLIEDATGQLVKWDPATQTWTHADS